MGPRLHRVEPGAGGIARRAAGRGFSYISANGRKVGSDKVLARITSLSIPPAWKAVWISTDPQAHIQATGIDGAGRKQYIYHPRWRELRDEEKFIRSLAFGQRLPAMRRLVTQHLKLEDGSKQRALAASVRLMDKAGLRVGGASYAQENGSFGAATLQRRHVRLDGPDIHLVFRGKAAGKWDVRFPDDLLRSYFLSVPQTPRNGPALCYRDSAETRAVWLPVADTDVNGYLAAVAGMGISAKDFRTWQGTVVAALSLARSNRAGTDPADAVSAAVSDAAQWLHNTPAIAKASYINPRLLERFEQGKVAALDRQPDRAVLKLLLGSG